MQPRNSVRTRVFRTLVPVYAADVIILVPGDRNAKSTFPHWSAEPSGKNCVGNASERPVEECRRYLIVRKWNGAIVNQGSCIGAPAGTLKFPCNMAAVGTYVVVVGGLERLMVP